MDIRKWEWCLLGLLFAITYISGLFVPLMENDSAQHASMAMRMVLQDDFVHLYKGADPYLDKPHLHFWLAALSMKLFGIYDWAYRIPSVLFLLMGAVCTARLTRLLYDSKQVSILAAFVFISAQTIILSAHDVRTDAVLTGAVIFGLYHFIAWIKNGGWLHAVGAALGMAMSLASKGMVGVGIIGLCVICYLLYSREWRKLISGGLLLMFFAFVLFILPLLYAYYVQFDMNPDQVVRGQTHVSGVRFILWDQSFSRASGQDFGQTSPDYFFFFHSLLWLLIPFSIIFYQGVFMRTRFFIVERFKKYSHKEFLTVGGFWLVIVIFSMSKFKLPHYMNSLIPVCAVLVASFIQQMSTMKNMNWIRINMYVQYLLFVVGIALMTYLVSQAFGVSSWFFFLMVILEFTLLIGVLLHKQYPLLKKLILSSLIFAAALNLFLNTQFYPPLTRYQAGLQISEQLSAAGISPADLIMLKDHTNWTLDFYSRSNVVRVEEEALFGAQGKYLFVEANRLEDLKSKGLLVEEKLSASQYRITMVKPRFLNKETRNEVLQKYVLAKII